MRSALAFPELGAKELTQSPRYGEAASYRSWQWLQPEERADWVVRKRREVSPFTALTRAIEESRSILRLPNDWDEMGSPAFAQSTWKRAMEILMLNAALLWQRAGLVLPAPRILPGPSGSIDLHWKTAQRELLVNVPEDLGEAVSYYGDNFGAEKKRGTIVSAISNLELFLWLTMTD